jgi:hypothetical protein
MSDWSVLVLVGLALAAAGGVFVLERLVPAKRREMHNDVFGFVYAIVGVAFAVLLGLVVVAAWNTLDSARANTYSETNALIDLDWYGHSLPQPAHGEIENLVKEYTEEVVKVEWPLLGEQRSSVRAWSLEVELRQDVQAQQPTTQAAVVRYQEALEASSQLGDARRLRINQADEGIPEPLWVALILGGAITIAFGYFFGMKSSTAHSIVMFSLTLLVVCLLLVIWEINYPFDGTIKVSPEAFELALQRMNLLSLKAIIRCASRRPGLAHRISFTAIRLAARPQRRPARRWRSAPPGYGGFPMNRKTRRARPRCRTGRPADRPPTSSRGPGGWPTGKGRPPNGRWSSRPR